MNEKTDKIRITIELPNGEKKVEYCDRYMLGLVTLKPVSEKYPNGESMDIIRSGNADYGDYCRYLVTMATANYHMFFDDLGVDEEE